MTDPTPPFSALRALEAATRHKSFTWAARELKISHSAVSQAIRRLEDDLGVRLFERRGGHMEPSQAAQRLAESYSTAAQQLTGIIRDITGEDPASRLEVGLSPELAELWLHGRLGRLGEALPDIQVAFSTERSEGGEFDAQLIIAPKVKPQDRVLAEIIYAPVCAPAFVEATPLATADEILAAPLLGAGREGWRVWTAKHAPRRTPRPSEFASTSAMVEAAAAGAGVAMATLPEVQACLATGQLALLPFPAPSGRSLVLRSRATPAKAEAIGRLEMWLKLELARDAAQLRRMPSRPEATPAPNARGRVA